jgi:copper chaperone NosL
MFYRNLFKQCLVVFFIWLVATFSVSAADITPQKPAKEDKCPVCGMFVYKYPDWIAQIIFSDGSIYFFDGAKDMFKFYLDLKKYAHHKNVEDISAIYVTEYYHMKLIGAKMAFFVIGSDVYGPMGKELIPFETEADANEFMQDHKGDRIIKFEHIKPFIIQKLD